MPRLGRPALVLSCEHGGNLVPSPFRSLFSSRAAQKALSSHRGYDLGALTLAEALRNKLMAPLTYSEVSRLVVDLNRSPTSRGLHSEFTKRLSFETKAALLREIYVPHRARVKESIEARLGTHFQVVHIAVHSFTPRLHGEVRTAEIGLLYDPSRAVERSFAGAWLNELKPLLPQARIRRNYPYLGTADGLTTAFRQAFPAERYLGLELEVNQAQLASRAKLAQLAQAFASSLSRLVAEA